MALNMKQGPFEIVNGELVKYHGDQAVIHVPYGVTRIGEGAFTGPVTFLGFSGPPPMCSWDGMEPLRKVWERMRNRVDLRLSARCICLKA